MCFCLPSSLHLYTHIHAGVELCRRRLPASHRLFVAKQFFFLFSIWIILQVDGNWVAVWQYLFGEVRYLEFWHFDVGNRNTRLDTISRHCCSRSHEEGKQTCFATSKRAHTRHTDIRDYPNARFDVRRFIRSSSHCLLHQLSCVSWVCAFWMMRVVVSAHFLQHTLWITWLLWRKSLDSFTYQQQKCKHRASFPAHVCCLSHTMS